MKKFLICGIALGVLLITSCGGGKKEEETPEVNIKTNPFAALEKMGNDMQASQNKGEEAMKKRRERGDTLAMPYAELQKFLPAAPAGYTAEEPGGNTINMPGASYSNAEVKFKKGDDYVKVVIMDYNQAYGMYTAATAMWAMGLSVDSPEEKAGGVKLDGNIGGWEVYRKKAKSAAVTLGVGSRFWVSVEASNQESSENVKNIVKTIDLKKLSEL
ncbi:MAG: hypothetical protein IAF38_07655 [Bacteroidia bacterium]|nr:hypothetical protein [Bacteroidia bacterium]